MLLWVCGRLHAENTFSQGVSGLDTLRAEKCTGEKCTLLRNALYVCRDPSVLKYCCVGLYFIHTDCAGIDKHI